MDHQQLVLTRRNIQNKIIETDKKIELNLEFKRTHHSPSTKWNISVKSSFWKPYSQYFNKQKHASLEAVVISLGTQEKFPLSIARWFEYESFCKLLMF